MPHGFFRLEGNYKIFFENMHSVLFVLFVFFLLFFFFVFCFFCLFFFVFFCCFFFVVFFFGSGGLPYLRCTHVNDLRRPEISVEISLKGHNSSLSNTLVWLN